MITNVQVASDNLKKDNNGYSTILHILETTNELIKINLAEGDEKIRQINIDLDVIMKITTTRPLSHLPC